MASSSYSFAVMSMVVLLQLLLISASSTKYINALCEHVENKTFCVQTLKAYPPVASASGKIPVAKAVLRLGISYAQKSARLVAKAAANEEPNMKKQFEECEHAFWVIVADLKSAYSELKEDAETANYDAQVCTDNTKIVKFLLGKNRDKASKNIMTMTLKMEKLIALAVGATELV
ncbi:hypothetical protein AALP_AAs51332U000100, partial [Arabis alpina]